tara:strand:- start:10455 stop:11078 length:624 start_codon:yes stop_codon:yes gene_type:complete
MESLISLYRRIGPDVLCLQEVQRQDVFDEVARRAGYDGHYTEGSTLRPYGGAMLWRKGRVVETSTQGDGTQRVWQIARCGFLTVCNVHLPSSRQLGAQRAAAQRVVEMGRATRATPDIVMGDLNEPPDGEVDRLLAEAGYADAALHTGQASRPSSLGGGRGDRIFVHSSHLDGLSEYGTLDSEDLKNDSGGKVSLSDHLPLWIRMEC